MPMFLKNILSSILLNILPTFASELSLRQCEPIRIDMCRNIGYNETAMPNMVGNELQNEVEYTLQTFTPLIEYVCSTQLKLFLCATYVPMCTPKVAVPIGPCRSLCESVRSHCHPVLQGFGYPWPPALECSRFPKENNQDSMCMEGPGETHDTSLSPVNWQNPVNGKLPQSIYNIDCPSFSKLYVKLHRLGRCAPLCNANILFTENDKHIAEMWASSWAYVSLAISFTAVLCLIFDQKSIAKNRDARRTNNNLASLIWCHIMVAIGWTIRFVIGRTVTSCGFDPQLPNISLLLVDGLTNIPCALNFFLRYYFGMASCAWWAILCLAWHRNVRSQNPDLFRPVSLNTIYPRTNSMIRKRNAQISEITADITKTHLVRFLGWGLPAFQTVAVIVTRLVDADELLGACFVGNQSDKGLQIFVATPLFCYWIFGAMNLSSGFLVYRRKDKDNIFYSTNSSSTQMAQPKAIISGIFLFIYCIPYGLLLLIVIYEFAKIDEWLNLSPYNNSESSGTPKWPFLLRVFIELTLSIICSVWIIWPKICALYKRQFSLVQKRQPYEASVSPSIHKPVLSNKQLSRSGNSICTSSSYRSVPQPVNTCQSLSFTNKTENNAISTNLFREKAKFTQKGRNCPRNCHTFTTKINNCHRHAVQTQQLYKAETIL